jgi:hypothetical protein
MRGARPHDRRCRLRRALLVLLSVAGAAAVPAASPVTSGERNDLPSCRSLLFKESPQDSTRRDYFVVVDRTVSFPESLLSDVIDRTERSIRPGDHVEVISFSGLTASEFTYVQLNLRIDSTASDSELESKIPAARIAATQRCFARQMALGKSKVREVLNSLLRSPLSTARRSEILEALATISHETIQPSAAHDKLVLVISDMLEYSDVASFYSGGALRLINSGKVLQTARANSLLGDFSGARIYVAGAATVSGQSSAIGLKERRALQSFWSEWFQESGGTVAAWGEPALLVDIQ